MSETTSFLECVPVIGHSPELCFLAGLLQIPQVAENLEPPAAERDHQVLEPTGGFDACSEDRPRLGGKGSGDEGCAECIGNCSLPTAQRRTQLEDKPTTPGLSEREFAVHAVLGLLLHLPARSPEARLFEEFMVGSDSSREIPLIDFAQGPGAFASNVVRSLIRLISNGINGAHGGFGVRWSGGLDMRRGLPPGGGCGSSTSTSSGGASNPPRQK